MSIPLEEGFTVVTGPNGSGKSNILDGVLFCLGLATSRGMRADRLPDLVNSGVLRAGKSAETEVSVRFDLRDWAPDLAEEGLEPPLEGPWIKSDQKEWTVTRRLRIMPGGSYSSSYAADGEPCNLQQLQTQLRRLRIDPEGSNVVMQGDVTRIVSMSNRDRRGLIDELAGVALFDHRIQQTRTKLDDVQERQERCRIVEQELLSARQRLERDCAKARTYKELKEKLQLGRQQELVLGYEASKKGLLDLQIRQQKLGEKELRDAASIVASEKKLVQSAEKLKILQENVKALGEDKLLAVQGEIAGLDTQTHELERQALQHQEEGEKLQGERQILINRRQEIQGETQTKIEDSNGKLLEVAEQVCKEAQSAVEVTRRRLGEVAGRSGVWLEGQRERSSRRQKLQGKVKPLQNEQQTLDERLLQIDSREKEFKVDQERDYAQKQQVLKQLEQLEKELDPLVQDIANQKKHIKETIEALGVTQKTRIRLEQEQARLEKDIARSESRREVLQESRGTGALRLLLEAGLDGIHGPVSQLGEVDDAHRLALEVAAGARLGQVVVDDDQIAAKAIDLLKRRKAGRLTFLPLNRMHAQGLSVNSALKRGRPFEMNKHSEGLIGRAVDLINFDPVYEDVFAYVFGETLVFSDLGSARIQLGRKRSVTLDGELLEKSGAMTGGSFSGKGIGLSFGRSTEGDDIEPLRRRLLELGETLVKCRHEEALQQKFLDEASPALMKLEQRQAALQAERTTADSVNKPLLDRCQESNDRIKALKETKHQYQGRLHVIAKEIEPMIMELEELEDKENLLEQHGDSQNWKQLQADLEGADSALGAARKDRDSLLNEQRERQLALERLEDQQAVLLAEEKRLQKAVQALTIAHKDWKSKQKDCQERRHLLEREQKELQNRFGKERLARDAAEADLANQRQLFQEGQWKLERLREDMNALVEEYRSGTIRLQELERSLPDPRPEISDEIKSAGLEALQLELQSIQNRMEALEPVNMLALEELEELNKRLSDLGERLATLSEERSELLLRIETVATLRQEAFMEAFEAVDSHFREIFASLSEGDGHLQLDNKDDPLEGGLTLVAHPKGKAVRRLAAMSGGEKSLTALSFLFALQRFRPSPFYALDEVDSFLDGVNVERLAALIACQAEQAQFLVVSHRRPMIGASGRTIGVTQARGAHTQVVGLPDAA